MDSILQDIIQSEDEALRLEDEAKRQSLEILTEARKKAEDIMEKALVEGEAMVEHILQQARNEALDERKSKEKAHFESNEQIKVKAREKLNEAVDYIVGRVVKKSWQW